MSPRRVHRSDNTQAPIVAALRGVGAKVWIVGAEVDLVVRFRGQTFLGDCKTPGTGHGLTPTQRQMLADGWPIYLWSEPDQALRDIGAIG